MELGQSLEGLFRGIEDLERRRAPRFAADAGICCAIRDPRTGDWHEVAIRDISATGVALLLDRPFQLGQLLTIELRRDKSGLSRKYLVEVRQADICYPNDDWLHGCFFARPLREDELRLWL